MPASHATGAGQCRQHGSRLESAGDCLLELEAHGLVVVAHIEAITIDSNHLRLLGFYAVGMAPIADERIAVVAIHMLENRCFQCGKLAWVREIGIAGDPVQAAEALDQALAEAR